ncbi:MAG: DUF3303 family protein [Gemmatimonadaceae bacterium]
MLFMTIERFQRETLAVYRRARDEGRQLPPGITFIESWVSADLARCFQLMECTDLRLLQEWVARWADLTEFEIVPVTRGRDTAEMLAPLL